MDGKHFNFFSLLRLHDMFFSTFYHAGFFFGGGRGTLPNPLPLKNNGLSLMDPNFGVCPFASPLYSVILI